MLAAILVLPTNALPLPVAHPTTGRVVMAANCIGIIPAMSRKTWPRIAPMAVLEARVIPQPACPMTGEDATKTKCIGIIPAMCGKDSTRVALLGRLAAMVFA